MYSFICTYMYIYTCEEGKEDTVLCDMSYTWTSDRVLGFSIPVELPSWFCERDLMRRQLALTSEEQISAHSGGEEMC